jgi:hypothetical protein
MRHTYDFELDRLLIRLRSGHCRYGGKPPALESSNAVACVDSRSVVGPAGSLPDDSFKERET